MTLAVIISIRVIPAPGSVCHKVMDSGFQTGSNQEPKHRVEYPRNAHDRFVIRRFGQAQGQDRMLADR